MPDHQGEVLGRPQNYRPPPGSLIVAGDVNVDLDRPRDSDEAALATQLEQWLAGLGVTVVPFQ
eukprot:7774755-Lingulodinium_polyedra.AAC.1